VAQRGGWRVGGCGAVAAEPGCCDAGASRRVAPPPNRKLPACRTADAVASWGEMRQDGEHVAWWW